MRIDDPLDSRMPGKELDNTVADVVDEARRQALEEAAVIAETYYRPAHTYTSENAEIYRAQDLLMHAIAVKIRKLKETV